ncbi:hypothetical protein ES703_41378 [subsurface metagenome]
MNNNSLEFSWPNFRWHVLKDLIGIIILFVLSIFMVYFTSQNITRLFFLLVLVLFVVSKKNYFWFAYFFIVAQGPGYFFADFSGTSLHRLPLYTFLAGMSFTPLDLFVLLVFLKALIKGRKKKLKLEKPLLLVLTYIVLSVIVSSLFYGTNVDVLAWNLRWVFCYSVIISFSYLMTKKHEIYRFFLLVFPFVFLIIFSQIYFVTTGSELINLLNPGFRGVALNTVTGELRPIMGGGLIVFFSFIFSVFLLVDRDYKLSKIYLYVIMAVAFLSIFLSATRLWFVIFSFIFTGYIFVSKKKIWSTLRIVSIFFLIISALIYSGLIPLNLVLQSSWGRVQQVFGIASGGLYSVDTAANRLINQLPVIMAIIKQNLIIGYGFSYISRMYYDNDFGFLNTILIFGVIGLSLFIFFFVKLLIMLALSIKKISIRNPFRISLKIMIIAWIGILIGYFTTWDFFTWYFDKVFFISILIALAEFFVMQADKEELRMKHSVNS